MSEIFLTRVYYTYITVLHSMHLQTRSLQQRRGGIKEKERMDGWMGTKVEQGQRRERPKKGREKDVIPLIPRLTVAFQVHEIITRKREKETST